MLTLSPMYETATLTVPTDLPTVIDMRAVPITPALKPHETELSDTHLVCSQAVRCTRVPNDGFIVASPLP